MKKQNGITLIALVITIIVMLILAGISLNATVGENGIITKTRNAHEETRGATVDEMVQEWKSGMQTSKLAHTVYNGESTEQIVNNLLEKNLITSDEKDIILGNEEKNIEAGYKINIGSKIIDFYTDDYRDGTPGLYATRTNILIKSWQELLDEEFITVNEDIIESWNKTKKGDLVISSTISKINNGAFNNNFAKKLTGVEFSDNLNEIGEGAFENCSGLTKLKITKGIEKIKARAFCYCTGLKEIRVESSTFELDVGNNPAFGGCDNVEKIIYEEGVTDIISLKCYSVKYISIPSTVTTIKDCAFINYVNLTSINIPSTLKEIGRCAFEGCIWLKSFTIEESIESIGMLAFKNCIGLNEVRIKNSNFVLDTRK